jgi:hypothetical protein
MTNEKVEAKRSELAQSLQERSDHIAKRSLLPSIDDTLLNDLDGRIGRQRRKLQRLEAESLQEQQKEEEASWEGLDQEQRSIKHPELIEEIRGLFLEMARRQMIDTLYLRRSDWDRVVYNHGPRGYQFFADATQAMQRYAQLTDRAEEEIRVLVRKEDFNSLLEWVISEIPQEPVDIPTMQIIKPGIEVVEEVAEEV